MADSSSPSHSKFLSLETEPGLAEDDDDEEEVNEYVSAIETEQHLRNLLDKERDFNYIQSQSHVDNWISVTRSEAIQWIINTRSVLQLRFHTAYLSVTYIDRFLSKSNVTMDKQWMIELLAVACLSLAAKMKERKAWALSSFPTEFEANSIQRMELLILTRLDWRLHSITPFHFIDFFISCFCNESSKKEYQALIKQIIFATTKDMKIMGHCSSAIAMAATLMVMDENLTRESLEMKLKTTWITQLFDHEIVYRCYTQMLELEPVKVNIAKQDLQNPSIGTKRKRLTFSEDENKPKQ